MLKKSNWAILLVVIFALVFFQASLVHAQDGTPTVANGNNQTNISLPWFVPVLFFVSILIGGTLFKQWVTKGTKKEFTGGSCCAPLVDEDRKP